MNPGQSLFVFVFYYNLCDIDLFALNKKDVCGILLYAKKKKGKLKNIIYIGWLGEKSWIRLPWIRS